MSWSDREKSTDRRGVRVPPRSTSGIRSITKSARSLFAVDTPRVDVVRLLEHTLHELGVQYEYCSAAEMNGDEGLTYPNTGVVMIREDVAEAAYQEEGRARFTIIHEIGHLVLHQGVPFARTQASNHKIYEDSEWQADTFAAEFLMPVEAVVLCRSVEEVMQTFGVSRAAAESRLRKLRKEGLLR